MRRQQKMVERALHLDRRRWQRGDFGEKLLGQRA
jgi:hypothetical protein